MIFHRIVSTFLVVLCYTSEGLSKRKKDVSQNSLSKIPKGKSSYQKGGRGDTCLRRPGDCGCGCPGVMGPVGPVGSPGVQGIQGVQGVQGVQGSHGTNGMPGSNGYKGQKGNRGFKGHKGDCGNFEAEVTPFIHRPNPLHIAFSVSMDTDMPKSSEYRVVKFNIILSNIGNAYDIKSGVFVAPVNGTYMVGFNGVSFHGQNILLHLVKNAQRILSAFDNSGCSCCTGKTNTKCAGSGSNVGILGLEQGDKIWIELPDEYGMHNALYHNYASFYGYLVHQYGGPKKQD